MRGIQIKKFLFENRSVRQTILKNTIWMTVAQVGSGFFRIALIIYATRMLGVAEWGIFSYTLGIASILAIFSDLGMTSFVTREMSKAAPDSNRYFATALFVKTGILAAGSLGMMYVSRFLPLNSPVSNLLPFLLLVIILDGLRDLVNALARSIEKLEIEALVNIGISILQLLIGFFLISSSPTSTAFAIVYIIGSGVGLAALFIRFHAFFKSAARLITPSLIKPMIRQSLPIGLATFTGAIMIHSDIIMAGYYQSSHDVGIYAAAFRFVQICTLALGLFVVPLIPIMARFADDTDRFAGLMQKSIQAALLIAIPIMGGGLAAAPSVVSFLYGDEYAAAIPVLRILILTVLVSFPAIIMSNALYALQKTGHLVIYSAIGILANIVLNFALIPSFGIIGVSYSTLIVQCILFIFLLSPTKINLADIAPRLWKTAMATVGMIIFIIAAQLAGFPDIVVLGGGTMIFGASIVLLKEHSLQEIKLAFTS